VETEAEPQPLGIARALVAVQEREQAGLVIFGKQSIDGDNSQTGQMFAALTGMPQATFASEVTIADGKAQVLREIDGGMQTLSVALPAVVTTDLRLNEPRYASLPNIMKAKKKPLDVLTPDELGVDMTPTVEVVKVEAPAERAAGIKVESVEQLVDKLKNEAKVIS
jgi:electron transfer flavoprotein beta subunit